MTREDAISIMNVIVHMLEEKYDTDRVEEAVDMAIKALEQEPCEDCQRIYKPNPYYDCISRQNAIDVMWEELDEDTAHKVRDILELQPSVMPNQEPCEDCISRKEVCNYIAEFVNHEYATDREHEMVEHIIGGIQHLPSIQPKPKTDVLDKIRAEIQEERLKNRDMEYDKIFELCILIIDKYTAESEGI